MNMYFIALVAPEKINQQVLKWKLWMKEHYHCEVALRSPAHITLIPPFWMRSELEAELINTMTDFVKNESEFNIQLKNFSFFKPRVIFVDVQPSAELAAVQNRLATFLIESQKFPVPQDNHPFHPHVTIATRDLYKNTFYESWEHFKNKEYSEEWLVKSISLLRHNKKNWDVIATSQLN